VPPHIRRLAISVLAVALCFGTVAAPAALAKRSTRHLGEHEHQDSHRPDEVIDRRIRPHADRDRMEALRPRCELVGVCK